MPIAVISWGTVRACGRCWPWAARLAYASMIGAKSVPALPKKYSTPREASSSRYASAALSTDTFFSMRSLLLFALQSQQPPRVALVDLLPLRVGGLQALHRRDRVANEPGPLLGI